MNTNNSAAFCIFPTCNGFSKASKNSSAAFCIPPNCNGANNGGQRPRVELALADPFKVLAAV